MSKLEPTQPAAAGADEPRTRHPSGGTAWRLLAAAMGALLLHLSLDLAAAETAADWEPESAPMRWLRKVDEHPVRTALALFLALHGLWRPGNQVRVESRRRNG